MHNIDLQFPSSAERLQQIINQIRNSRQVQEQQLPGIAGLLDEYIDPNVDLSYENLLRRLLKVFKDSTTDGTYSLVLKEYQSHETEQIRQFVEQGKSAINCGRDFVLGPSLGARNELPMLKVRKNGKIGPLAGGCLSWIKNTVGRLIHNAYIYDDVKRRSSVAIYVDIEWQNWGRTVGYKPKITAVPRTSHGIQEIVKYAKKHDMNVRASGYRHSWSPIFGRGGQITISTLGLHRSSDLPNIESLPGSQYFESHTELSSIDFVSIPQKGQKRLVRVGAAVTNEQLRKWCNDQQVDFQSTLPFNAIIVEVTAGGLNASICHGAGRTHSTLSDLVHIIEYVDVNGNMQTIDKEQDPSFMLAASGCFGLIGIVTHLTLELDSMSYAVLIPRKLPIMQAIPPPPGMKDDDIPDALRTNMTTAQRMKAQADFERQARDSFYAEWFWFPYTSQVWVNCWDTTEDSTGAVEYPSNVQVFLQFAQTVAIQILQTSEAILDLQKVLPWAQATLISKLGLNAMPNVTDPKDQIKTKLPNALHFRRAVQNVRVLDMEIEIPLQPATGSLKDARFGDKIDFSLVQKAWWDAILTAYKHTDKCPQRMPLEMRITGPSDVTLSPHRGHNLGTCSIEVLTLEVMSDIWQPYKQEILDHWMSLKDNEGDYLLSRPHWAKEWWGLLVRGQPMLGYLKESYAGAIIEFRHTLGQIARKQGWSLDEAQKRFSNELFDQTVFQTEVKARNGTKKDR